jgi:hypothetical protein
MKNSLQQIILNVIEEMDSGDVYGSLPSASVPSGNNLYNQDTYSKGYHAIPFKHSIQKRNFPELINTENKKLTNLKNKKPKLKKIKHGKQKQK